MTIIDFKNKFIFIANKKTGSTTIHNYLKRFSSNHSIYSKKSIFDKPIGKHDSYLKIKSYLESINVNIDKYYIFGFIRNPCDRIKSCYKYEKYKNFEHLKDYNLNSDDFNKYIKLNLVKHFDPVDKMFFNENNEIPINITIFKLENLNDSIDIIFENINFKKYRRRRKIIKENYTDDIKLEISSVNKYILYYRYPYDFSFYKN